MLFILPISLSMQTPLTQLLATGHHMATAENVIIKKAMGQNHISHALRTYLEIQAL